MNAAPGERPPAIASSAVSWAAVSSRPACRSQRSSDSSGSSEWAITGTPCEKQTRRAWPLPSSTRIPSDSERHTWWKRPGTTPGFTSP